MMDTNKMNYDLERRPDSTKRLSLYQKAFGERMARKNVQKETADNGTNGGKK